MPQSGRQHSRVLSSHLEHPATELNQMWLRDGFPRGAWRESMWSLIRRLDLGTTAHSDDLRSRVVAEVLAGASRRQAAERFKVSAASAVRWAQLYSQTGGVGPRPRGGKSRSPLEPHAA